MSKITLKPLDDGQKAVVIPLGKTTIGRGPFLGCSDKKVSRNHAVLEVTSKGEVYLTPTHVNPCFFLQPGVGEGDPGLILKKDVPHKLEDGETFSLLPRAYRYQLSIIQDRNEVSKGETNGSARDALEHKETEEQPTVAADDPPEKEASPPKEEPSPLKENHTKEESTGEEEGSNNHTKEKEEPKAVEEEKKEDKESCEESRDEGTLDTLPSKVSEEEEEEEEIVPIKRGKKQETKNTTTKRKAGGTRGGVRKKLAARFDFEEGASSSQRVSGGRTSSRTNRQTRQGLSLEDFVVSDDEEWQSFDEASPRRRRKKRGPGRKRGEESGSDWETEHKRPKKTPKGGEGSEESGSDWGTSKKKGGKRRKGKALYESEEAGSEPDQGPAPSTAKPRTNCTHGKKCYRRNQSHVSEFSHPGDSDYEETDPKEEEETVKKECPYGANCFRKNAQHKRDFKHTKKVRPQREAAKLADKKAKGSKNSEEVDSYDLNESFLNDDSADEYKPADSGSDYESGTKKVAKAKVATKGAKRGRKA